MSNSLVKSHTSIKVVVQLFGGKNYILGNGQLSFDIQHIKLRAF